MSFVKGKERPSAKEWQDHLAYLLKNLKQCKKNHNHAYFTSKGCGMCIMEEKFAEKIKKVRKEKAVSQQVRGLDISAINVEKTKEQKEMQNKKVIKLRKLYLSVAVLYFLFFSSFYYICNPLKSYLTVFGKGVQLILIILFMFLLNKIIKSVFNQIRFFDRFGIANMLLIFAFCCMLLTFFLINDFPENLWTLSR